MNSENERVGLTLSAALTVTEKTDGPQKATRH